MDELLASAFETQSPVEIVPARLRKIFMTEAETEAARLLHRKFSQIDIALVSKPSEAASRILSALPILPLREDILRRLACDLGEEVLNHPEACSARYFTLHLRMVSTRALAAAPVLRGKRIARLVVLPVNGAISPRGNFMPDDILTFCENCNQASEDFLFLMIYPNHISDEQLIDPQQESRTLSDLRVMQVRNIQGRILAEAMTASVNSHEAGAALFPTLSHLRRIGVQLALYQSVRNSGVSPGVKESRLLQLHQILGAEARALACSFGRDILNEKLPTALREALRYGLKDLQTTGLMSIRPEFETRSVLTPRLSKTPFVSDAPQMAPAKIIPLRKKFSENRTDIPV